VALSALYRVPVYVLARLLRRRGLNVFDMETDFFSKLNATTLGFDVGVAYTLCSEMAAIANTFHVERGAIEILSWDGRTRSVFGFKI
jgi:hypothetical protein